MGTFNLKGDEYADLELICKVVDEMPRIPPHHPQKKSFFRQQLLFSEEKRVKTDCEVKNITVTSGDRKATTAGLFIKKASSMDGSERGIGAFRLKRSRADDADSLSHSSE